jgi:hypothetical protein
MNALREKNLDNFKTGTNRDALSTSIKVKMSPRDKWAFEHQCNQAKLAPPVVMRELLNAFVLASKRCDNNRSIKVKWPYQLRLVEEKEVDE